MDQFTHLYADVWRALLEAFEALDEYYNLLEAWIWDQMSQARIPIPMQPFLLGLIWLLMLFVAVRLMVGTLRLIVSLFLILLLVHLLRHFI